MLAPLPMTRREDDHVQEASAILLKRDVVKEVVPRPNRWFYHGVMGAKGWLKLVKEKGLSSCESYTAIREHGEPGEVAFQFLLDYLEWPTSVVFRNLNHQAEVAKFKVSFNSIWCCSPIDLISAISLSSRVGCNPEFTISASSIRCPSCDDPM
nr:hypothetical protein Iba_chr01bCG2920 [Ipomoea batatas]